MLILRKQTNITERQTFRQTDRLTHMEPRFWHIIFNIKEKFEIFS